VEVGLGIELGVGQEVDHCSLLNEFILFINSGIFELLFGVSQMLVLDDFNIVSPLVTELFVLVVGVHIVECCEFWTKEVSEMSDLQMSNIKGNEELMMPDHCSKPIIMLPSTKSGDCVDRCDIKTEQKNTSSGS